MSPRFSGEHTAKLDAKNRVIVPTKFRELVRAEPEAGFVLARGVDDCLDMYSPRRWNVFQREFMKKKGPGFGDEQLREFARYFFGSAQPVVPDKQGRVLVAEHLLQHAGLTKEVVFVGVSDKIEIWDAEVYAARREKMRASFKKLASSIFSQKSEE